VGEMSLSIRLRKNRRVKCVATRSQRRLVLTRRRRGPT